MPAEAHLGRTTREIFGAFSETTAEPSYRRVLVCDEVTHFEFANVVLPTRPNVRFSALNTNFPIRDHAGKVKQIGIVVVEVSEQRKLETLLHRLAGELRNAKTKETFWFARELQDSIDQYHMALGLSFHLLIGNRKKSTELLAQSVEALDQRIMRMSALVSTVVRGFGSDK